MRARTVLERGEVYMDCGGRAKRRHRFGCDAQWLLVRALGVMDGESKAVSPLRSATAVQTRDGRSHAPRFIHSLARLPLALFASVAVATSAHAQPFTVDWFTVDGGGGTSAGGQFSVSGTIGQPDASPAPLAGGTFSVIGGFWSFPSVTPLPAPAAVLIHVAVTMSGQIEISAQATPGATATVQANSDLANPNGWVNLGMVSANAAGLMSFIDTDSTNYPMRFYRFHNNP